ncbi:MAG: AfsR/SARP family transcriptional regulator, partial [Acidimicrobiales bacterium]
MSVRLLGPLEITVGDAVIRLGGPKERAVLAILALRPNRVVSVDHLLDAMWGDDPPATAPKVLQNHVVRLRKRLAASAGPGPSIVTRPSGYQLTADAGDIDVAQAEGLRARAQDEARRGRPAEAATHLRAALDLWRGPALEEFLDLPFAIPEAQRLGELRLVMTEERIDAELACGLHADCVAELEVLTDAHPLRERLWSQRMLALYRCGRQPEALRAYQAVRTYLGDELGLDCSAELTALEALIVRQSPDLDLPGTALPSGAVTFVWAEIDGSAALFRRGADRFAQVVEAHRAVMRGATTAQGGAVVRMGGDTFLGVFGDPIDALRAAAAAQVELLRPAWAESADVRVRMGVRGGHATPTADGDYASAAVHEAAQLCAVAHGGQVLVADDVASVALDPELALLDLGEQHVPGLGAPLHLHQLTHPALPDRFPPLRTNVGGRAHLPVARTSFVGREDELDAILAALRTAPMVTVTGVGGVGKTRLAVEAARLDEQRHPDGVHLIELASQLESDRVVDTVGAALGLIGEGNRPLDELLADWARDRRALLVVDNCEHVLDGVAHVLDRMLRAGPALQVLTTSREPIEVEGELVVALEPLPVPGADVPALAEVASVRLFLDRAAVASPGFVLTADNTDAVRSVCDRLDGIPLAIELAAARLRHTTAAELDGMLDDRFAALQGGPRTRPPRQRTMDAAIAWSFDLLAPEEQRTLARLSVLPGGWTLETAEQLCPPDVVPDVRDALERLVDRS